MLYSPKYIQECNVFAMKGVAENEAINVVEREQVLHPAVCLDQVA